MVDWWCIVFTDSLTRTWSGLSSGCTTSGVKTGLHLSGLVFALPTSHLRASQAPEKSDDFAGTQFLPSFLSRNIYRRYAYFIVYFEFLGLKCTLSIQHVFAIISIVSANQYYPAQCSELALHNYYIYIQLLQTLSFYCFFGLYGAN